VLPFKTLSRNWEAPPFDFKRGFEGRLSAFAKCCKRERVSAKNVPWEQRRSAWDGDRWLRDEILLFESDSPQHTRAIESLSKAGILRLAWSFSGLL